MEPIESEGRTVAEAVESALRQSGLRRDQVEIAVLQESSAGFMGLGAKPARVRLTEKRWGPGAPPPPPAPAAPAPRQSRPPQPERRRSPRPERPRGDTPRRPEPRPAREPREGDGKPFSPTEAAEACRKAQELVTDLLKLMSVAAPTVTSSWDADLERVKIVVESQDATLLVGRDGRVLEALQFLATLMLSRGAQAPLAVQVDALSYWEKREQSILEQARRAVENVRATGKPYRLEPMDASMRRLIHRSFASYQDVSTSSEGEGAWRKIVIRPRSG